MRYHYIYKITCLCGQLKDHYYIGKHSTDAVPENCGYCGSGKIINNYFKKYGKIKGVTYNIEIIEKNPNPKINSIREKEIIGNKFLKDTLCINLKAGGDGGGVAGSKRSETTKKKISQSLKGNPQLSHKGTKHPMYGKHVIISDEQREKISKSLRGIKRTEEEREKIRKRMIGTKMKQEVKQKISKSLKGNKPWNRETNSKSDYIEQYTKEGQYIRTWNLKEDDFLPYRLCHIKECCNGIRKSANNYIWVWKYQ